MMSGKEMIDSSKISRAGGLATLKKASFLFQEYQAAFGLESSVGRHLDDEARRPLL